MAQLTKAQRFFVGAVADEVESRLGVTRDEPPPDLGDVGPLPHQWDDIVYGQTPAAGASYTYTVATSMTLYSVMARLMCSNVAGDRSLTLEYQDGSGSRFCVAGANVTLAASQSQSFCWQPTSSVGSWPVDDVAVAPLPVQPLRAPWLIVVRLAGTFDVADQIDTVRLAARFYVEA